MPKLNTYQIETRAFTILSNNKETVTINSDDIAIDQYKELGIMVLNPLVDTIILTYDLQGIPFPCQQEQVELVSTLAQALVGFAKEKPADGQAANSFCLKTDAYKQGISIRQGYDISVVYVHPMLGAEVHIQMLSPTRFVKNIGSKRRNPLFKLTFNPVDLTHTGLYDFFTWFDLLSYNLSIAQHMLTTPKLVKEIHIAVDILGASLEQVQLVYTGKNKMPDKKTLYLGTDHTLESLYAKQVNKNGTRLKKNGIYLYDKRACQKAKGMACRYGEALHIRWERRTSFGGALIELGKMDNRLGGYEVNILNMKAFRKQGDKQKLFSRLLLKSNEQELAAMLKGTDTQKMCAQHHDMMVSILNNKNKKQVWQRFGNAKSSHGVMQFFENPTMPPAIEVV